MGNLLQYTDKAKTIDNKINTMIAAVQYDYYNGNIRTESEYYYRLKNVLSDFYISLVKPTFIFRPAVSTPMSDEYNAMINEGYNDMAYVIKDCEALEDFVSRSFSDAEFSRNMMKNRLSMLAKSVSSLIESTSTNESGTITVTELFSNLDNTGNSGDERCLCVDTTNSMLRLSTHNFGNVPIDSVEIDSNESNGLPGTSHVANILNSELYFDGQDNMHCQLSSVIDKNKDTWFEFESFNISDNTRIACNSLGFEYEEGVRWVTDNQFLRLKLIIYVTENIKCSWITLNPYLSEIKGIKNCYIETCDVVTAENTTYRVAKNMAFDELICLCFPACELQRVELTLVQTSKYLTNVGHFYYTMSNTSSTSLFQNMDDTDQFARIDGPKPSVGLLGCKYDPTTKWVKYGTSEDNDYDYSKSQDSLFYPVESTVDRKSCSELIEAYRYMIGIREIELKSCRFNEYGKYVSIAYHTEEEITSVSIQSDEYIPDCNSESIQYFISLNNGLVWHKIYPTHRAYQGVYRYYINNDTIANQLSNKDEKRSQNLSVIGRADSIMVKIEMYRNQEMEYSSPIVYNYRLKLTTGGETIEY